MTALPAYFHLPPGSSLPELSHLAPFRAVVIIDTQVTPEWQAKVSAWLVRSGSLYVQSWGQDCSAWDDSVDMANIEQFDFGDIPEDQSVVTTWHANESLSEVFDYCKRHAIHPTVELSHTVLLHIVEQDNAAHMIETYAAA